MLKVQEFISTHDNWAKLLAASPYHLRIKQMDGLILLCYNQYSEPSEIVNECRGLILDADNNYKVVRYGLRRFYDVEDSNAVQIDWQNCRWTLKVDGTLIMLYYYHDKWHISTRTMFDSDGFANDGKTTFEELAVRACKESGFSFDSLNPKRTYVFELVSPKNRIVIPYSDYKLYYIMERDNETFEEFYEPPRNVESIDTDMSFSSVEEAKEYCDSFSGLEFEGFVVTDIHHNRVKIKNVNWLNAHYSLTSSCRYENVLQMIFDGTSTAFLEQFPETGELFRSIHQHYIFICLKATALDNSVHSVYKFETKKEFANYVLANVKGARQKLMFKAWDGKAYEWVKSLDAATFWRSFGEEWENHNG